MIGIAKFFKISVDDLLNDSLVVNNGNIDNNHQSIKKKYLFSSQIIKLLITLLACLPLVITVSFMPFFPDLIPAHYDFSGQITRWGSKYENLIFPITIIILVFVFFKSIKTVIKHYQKNNMYLHKIRQAIISLYVTLMIMEIIFATLSIWLLVKSYSISIEKYDSKVTNLFAITGLYSGIVLSFLGCLMPFVSQNIFFGIRTSRTLGNVKEWKRSHTFGGCTLGLSGIITVIFNLFFDIGPMNLIISSILIAVSLMIIFAYEMILSRKSRMIGKKF